MYHKSTMTWRRIIVYAMDCRKKEEKAERENIEKPKKYRKE